MTSPLARPLTTDNRVLRAVGAMDIRLPLSEATAAVFEAPMTTGLLGRQIERAGAASEAFTGEQFQAFRLAEDERSMEIAQLQSQLMYTLGDEREAIGQRLAEISTERKEQLDSFARESLEAGRTQPPDVLTEQYKELGLTFDRAMTADEARLIAEGKKEEIIRQAIIQQAPSGVVPTVAMFGAGLGAMAVDPLEVASMFIPIVGQAGKAAAVARFGRIGGRTVTGAIEGGVGSALTEPLFFALSRAQQLDYTMSDALLNVGLGFVLGGGIGTGVGVASRRAEVPMAPRTETSVPALETGMVSPETAWMRAEIFARRAAEQRVAAQTAARQFSMGQGVHVDPVMPRFSAQDALDQLQIELTDTKKYPLTARIRKEIAIHPDGKVAEELRAMGVTPRTLPGLFSRAGRRDLDNLVASEWEEMVPGITARAGGDGEYLSQQGLIEAIADELRSGGETAGVLGRMMDAEADVSRLSEVYDAAREAGVVLRDEAEVRFVHDYLARTGDLDAALERVAMRGDEIGQELAQNARLDPVEDIRASRRFDDPFEEFMGTDIADMENMVRQIEDLSPDARADMAAIADIRDRARAYAEAAEAAATCVART